MNQRQLSDRQGISTFQAAVLAAAALLFLLIVTDDFAQRTGMGRGYSEWLLAPTALLIIVAAASAWRSFRQWAPLYKSLGLSPLPQRGASSPPKMEASAVRAKKRESPAQSVGRKSKQIAAVGLEFISFWSLRGTFLAYRLLRSVRTKST